MTQKLKNRNIFKNPPDINQSENYTKTNKLTKNSNTN